MHLRDYLNTKTKQVPNSGFPLQGGGHVEPVI